MPQQLTGSCPDRCELASLAQSICVPSKGSEQPDFYLIGEAPGREEDAEGICFTGKAGKKLDFLLRTANLTSRVRIGNLVRCCPYKDASRNDIGKPKAAHIKPCAPQHLVPELIKYKPKLVVPMGGPAWNFFGKGNIKSVRGNFYQWEATSQQYPALIPAGKKVILDVMPTFHPSYATRGNVAAERAILEDFENAKRFVSGVQPDIGNYYLIDTVEAAHAWLTRIAEWYESEQIPFVVCDLETTSLDWRSPQEQITAVGFSWAEGYGLTIPFNGKNSPHHKNYGALMSIRAAMKDLFSRVPIVGQYFEFDRRWLWQHLGLRVNLLFDTISASKWLDTDSHPHGLEYLASLHANMHLHKKEAQAAEAYEEGGMGEVDIGIVNRLCSGDCDATFRVAIAEMKKLEKEGTRRNFDEWNMRSARSLFSLDMAGAYFDKSVADRMEKTVTTEMREILEHVKKMNYQGQTLNDIFRAVHKKPEQKKIFNIGFGTERARTLLYAILRMPAPKDRSTKELVLKNLKWSLDRYPLPADWDGLNPMPQTMEWVLICREVLSAIMKYRGLQHVLGSHVRKFRDVALSDSCVHADHHWNQTRTGRSSVSNPPLQTLPKKEDQVEFKECFVSRFNGGLLLNSDESQFEVRCLAHISQDRKLIELFHLGVDIHIYMASIFHGKPMSLITKEERNGIKPVIFGLFYDRGAEGIAEAENMDVVFVQGVIDAFWTEFSDAKKWKDTIVWETQQTGRSMSKDQMRHRVIHHINNRYDRKLKAEAEREAGNHPVQSLASDLTHHGSVRVNDRIEAEGYLSLPFLFVHDNFAIDIFPGELFELLQMQEYEFVEHAHQLFPNFSVPFKMEHEVGLNLREMVAVTIEDGFMVSSPTDSDLLNAIASVIETWYNSRSIEVVKGEEDLHILSASFDPCAKPGRGEQWVSWYNENYKTPALQPYYKNWI